VVSDFQALGLNFYIHISPFLKRTICPINVIIINFTSLITLTLEKNGNLDAFLCDSEILCYIILYYIIYQASHPYKMVNEIKFLFLIT